MTFRKERYPAEWKAIRAGILLRANNACEQCRAPNGAIITRGEGRDAAIYMLDDGQTFDAITGAPCGLRRGSEFEARPRSTVVVLTVAHLDHDESHNAPENLQALCQRCHLAHDRVDNLRRRRATERASSATPVLPGLEGES